MAQFRSLFAQGNTLFIYQIQDGQDSIRSIEFENDIICDGVWRSSVDYINPDQEYLNKLSLRLSPRGEVWFHEQEVEIGPYVRAREVGEWIVFLLEGERIVHIQRADAESEALPDYSAPLEESSGFTKEDIAEMFGQIEEEEEARLNAELLSAEQILDSVVEKENAKHASEILAMLPPDKPHA